MSRQTHSVSSRRLAALQVVMLGAFVLSCGVDEDSSSPFPTPTPSLSQRFDRQVFLIAREDGVYSLGVENGGATLDMYPEPRLWIPWPLVMSQRWDTPLREYPAVGWPPFEVDEVDIAIETDAGTFQDVVVVKSLDHSLGDTFFHFRAGVGVIQKLYGQGRGHIFYYLTKLSVHAGDNALEERFGLVVGNTWRWRLDGTDSVTGKSIRGSADERVLGRRTVNGQDAIVLGIAGTIEYE